MAGSRVLVEAELHKGRIDLPGALTSIGGMSALVYGITSGGEHGWTDSVTLASFAAAAILLPLFVMLQARRRDPLVPLRLFKDRNRAGSYLSTLLLAVGPMGAFYVLTLYMQHIVGLSPISTGLAWLPFGAGIVLGEGISSKLVLRFAPREVAVPGMLLVSGALFWLSAIGPEFAYVSHFAPAVFLMAFGFAMGLISLTLTAVKGVQPQETGVASALLNASQQIGVAFGLAVLSTVSVTTTAGRLPGALTVLYSGRESGDAEQVRSASDALIHGYGTALATGGVALVAAAVIAAVLINAKKEEVSASGDVPLH